LTFDAAGNPYGAPVDLGPDGGSGALVRRGDQVLAAWTENHGTFQQASTTIRVGRVDLRGNPIGPSDPLQSQVLHQQNVQPRWITVGNDLGLAWSQGKIIYICAGCVPDNRIKFVILGGLNLTRRSEVLDLPSPTTAGGLLEPQLVGSLSNFLLVSSLTYHVSAEGSSATIVCRDREE
jgi:hypothetical protein